MFNKRTFSFILAVGLFYFAPTVNASCQFSPTTIYPQSQTIISTIPLSSLNNLSAPPGTPVGQIIYRQTISISQGGNSPGLTIKCSGPGSLQQGYEYASLPWPVSNYSDTVYRTNLPGVGVRVNQYNIGYPIYESASICFPKDTPGCSFKGLSLYANLDLIKISEDLAPGTINGTDLPIIRRSYGQAKSMVSVYEFNFSGSLTITTPTCNITTTSGVMTVRMGENSIKKFTGKGSATPWKNAGITLTCPETFYGNSGVDNLVVSAGDYSSGTGTTTGSLRQNFWQLNLTPANGTIDATKGIIAINDSPIKATGIGIQLSKSANNNGIIDLNSRIVGLFSNTGTKQIIIPLYARYIQTEDKVLPGRADGNLIYTISYQ